MRQTFGDRPDWLPTPSPTARLCATPRPAAGGPHEAHRLVDPPAPSEQLEVVVISPRDEPEPLRLGNRLGQPSGLLPRDDSVPITSHDQHRAAQPTDLL